MNWFRKLIIGNLEFEIERGVLRTLKVMKSKENKAMACLTNAQKNEIRELFPNVVYFTDVEVLSYLLKKASEKSDLKKNKYKKEKKK